jgi:hypothetical protein
MLPEARQRLAAVIATLDRLRDETAWECRAAREYRIELASLIDDVRRLRDETLDLELDVRSVWRHASVGVW